jgi:hypothetical protein
MAEAAILDVIGADFRNQSGLQRNSLAFTARPAALSTGHIASEPLRTPLISQTGPNTSVKRGCWCSNCEKRCISGPSHSSRMVGIRSYSMQP